MVVYAPNRKTMNDLFFHTAYMVKLEKIKAELDAVNKLALLNEERIEIISDITEHREFIDEAAMCANGFEYYENYNSVNFEFEVINPMSDITDQRKIIDTAAKRGIELEYYENYNSDNMEFEEINPMSEISFTPHNNNSVISGKRDCSVQTDNMFINKKINTQNKIPKGNNKRSA